MLDLLGALRRRRVGLAVWLVIGAGLALMVSLLLPPTYRAEARVLVEAPSPASALLAQMAELPLGLPGLLGAPATAAEIEVLRSRPILRSVVGPPGTSEISPDTGLDLAVRVDDLDAQSLWRQYLRRLTGRPEPEGTLVVRFEGEEPVGNRIETIEIEFLAADEVRLVVREWFDQRSARRSFVPGEPFDFGELSLVLETEGDLTGRSFEVSWRSLPRALRDFEEELQVRETQRGTNVLEVSFGARTRAGAARVTNALVRSYLAHSRERAVRRADRSVEYVESELERVRRELEAAEEDLATFGREAGKVALPENALALVEALSEVDLERARLELEAARIADLSARLESDELSLEALAGLERSGFLGEESSEVTPLAELLAARAVLRGSYTEDWPELRRAQREIDERRTSIAETLAGVAGRNREEARDLDRILTGLLEELGDMPAAQVELVRHTRRIEATGQIYLYLLAQREESRITMATAVPSVEVIEWAAPPLRRSSPSLRVNLAIGLVLGLFFGLAFGLLAELRRSVVDPGRLAELGGAPGLGKLGRGKAGRPLPVRDRPASAAADGFRSLRDALATSTQATRRLAVVSAVPREGRSRTAANLALACAQGGERVLLVEADFTAPVLARWFGRAPGGGLGEALGKAHAGWQELVVATGERGLDLLPAGRTESPFADRIARGEFARLLDSAGAEYDRVVVDTSALEAGASGPAAAAACDASLFVCRSGRVPEARVAEAFARLARSGGRVVGVVLNGV